MKNKKLLLIFIVLSISLLFLIPNTKAFDDINYVFQKDILFDDSDPELNLFNMRAQQVYNGTYGGTYSFTDEIDGTNSTDIDFVDIDSSTGGVNSIHIVSEIEGHKKVLQLLHDSGGGLTDMYNYFNIFPVNETIEYWVRTTNPSHLQEMDIYGSTPTILLAIQLKIDNDLIYYNAGAGYVSTGYSVSNNTWIHFSIQFDCGVNNYNLYINGALLGNYGFKNNVDDMVRIRLVNSGSANYSTYFDAFGYSWDLNNDVFETYDFTNDIVGNEPIGWNINNDVSCLTNITPSLDGRTNILAIYDNNPTGIANISNNFNEMSIQFDLGTSFYQQNNFHLLFLEKGNTIADLYLLGNDLFFYDGSAYQTVDSNIIVNDVFEVIKIIFNFVSETADIYINSILEGNNMDYSDSVSEGIDTINPITELNPPVSSYIIYLDNIGVPYFIGQNFKPILETLEGFEGLLETDKYEFALLNVNTLSEVGDDSFGVWSFSETGSGNAQIIIDPLDFEFDNQVRLEGGVNIGTASMTRTALSITNSLVDVNFGFEFTLQSAMKGVLTVLLEGNDTSVITGFKMDLGSGNFSYWDGSWNVLRNDVAFQEFYDINLFLNYDLDVVRLEYIVDGIFITYYYFDMVSTGKTGLYEIEAEFSIGNGEGGTTLDIDYIGLYRDGESWHGELGFITTPLNVDYNFRNHYLYSIVGNGRFHEGVAEGNYVVGESPFQSIRNISTISSTPKDDTLNITNTGNFFWTNMENATLVFTCVGSEINISSINIEGSKLVQNSNEYFLEFSSSGLDSRDNYFYVSGNDLRFIHNTKFDNVLEFIQASFNINDITSTDTVISYLSNIEANAFGFFRINYTDTSQIIPIETTLKSKRIFLTPNKTIRSLVILISDTDKNDISGLTTGLVSDITLLDVENAIVSIVSLSLIEMIIPLIIILLPTLAISSLYGEFLVVPVFLLMSLITTITNIIPIWLFFVIALSNVLFIFFDNKRKDIE